jgi:hypothetical protein
MPGAGQAGGKKGWPGDGLNGSPRDPAEGPAVSRSGGQAEWPEGQLPGSPGGRSSRETGQPDRRSSQPGPRRPSEAAQRRPSSRRRRGRPPPGRSLGRRIISQAWGLAGFRYRRVPVRPGVSLDRAFPGASAGPGSSPQAARAVPPGSGPCRRPSGPEADRPAGYPTVRAPARLSARPPHAPTRDFLPA